MNVKVCGVHIQRNKSTYLERLSVANQSFPLGCEFFYQTQDVDETFVRLNLRNLNIANNTVHLPPKNRKHNKTIYLQSFNTNRTYATKSCHLIGIGASVNFYLKYGMLGQVIIRYLDVLRVVDFRIITFIVRNYSIAAVVLCF